MEKEKTAKENKPLEISLLALFVFSAWFFLSAILNFRQDIAIVFVGFFALITITMRVNNLKFNNKTLAVAVIGAILFTIFVVFCTVYSVPDRDIYNFSTFVTAVATAYGQR